MSYSTLPAPSDIFGPNSGLRSRVFPPTNDHRSDESHSPTSEPRSPLFRPALPAADLSPHLVSLYNSPYAAAAVAAAMAGQGAASPSVPAPHFSHFGRVPSSFYPPMVGGEAWRRSPYLSQLDMYWPGLRSLDAVVGPRTKAPREATSILKSWLNEHKDNPYPTKSEKMTLSIVTHMTLTQVSTWFANARRRIKKENKMTWTPKTRTGERDDNSSNEEESDRDYFGRHQRSPFSTSRDSTEGSLPPYTESKRHALRQARNTIPCSLPGMPSSIPTYPMLSSFNGLNSDCRRQNVGGMSNVIDAKFPDRSISQSKRDTPNSANVSINEKSYSNTSPGVKHSMSDDQRTMDDDKEISRPPFIQLGKRRSFSVDRNCTSTDCGLEGRQSPKRPHYSHPREVHLNNAATEGPDVSHGESINQTYNAYRLAMRDRNADAISSWMKDFQHLVSTGQDDKARQALAAFAIAAKAGAYPDLGSSALHSVKNLPNNDCFERKSPVRKPVGCHSPNTTILQKPFPHFPNTRRHGRSLGNSDSSDGEANLSLPKSSFPDVSTRNKSHSSAHSPDKESSGSDIPKRTKTTSANPCNLGEVSKVKSHEYSSK